MGCSWQLIHTPGTGRRRIAVNGKERLVAKDFLNPVLWRKDVRIDFRTGHAGEGGDQRVQPLEALKPTIATVFILQTPSG